MASGSDADVAQFDLHATQTIDAHPPRSHATAPCS